MRAMYYPTAMCRSIKVLRRAGEVVTVDELNAAALQFVRKISGFHKPSKANQAAFERAIEEVAASSRRLLEAVGQTTSPTQDRAEQRIAQ
jgi:hypothetical protein